MDSNFSTICEDESTDELGVIICELYNKCGEGSFDLVNSILHKETLRKGVVSQSIGCDKGDEIYEDGEEEGGDCGDAEAAMEAVLEEELPKVDPEGWETVTKKKKRPTGK